MASNPTLSVGNLRADVTEKEIIDTFTVYGEICGVRVEANECFVDFNSVSHATRAIDALNGKPTALGGPLVKWAEGARGGSVELTRNRKQLPAGVLGPGKWAQVSDEVDDHTPMPMRALLYSQYVEDQIALLAAAAQHPADSVSDSTIGHKRPDGGSSQEQEAKRLRTEAAPAESTCSVTPMEY